MLGIEFGTSANDYSVLHITQAWAAARHSLFCFLDQRERHQRHCISYARLYCTCVMLIDMECHFQLYIFTLIISFSMRATCIVSVETPLIVGNG